MNELFPSALELDKQLLAGPLRSRACSSWRSTTSPRRRRNSRRRWRSTRKRPKSTRRWRSWRCRTSTSTRPSESIERALEINPKLLAAHWASADIHLANYEAAEAAQRARSGAEAEPRSEETLGRLAAAYAVVDGWSDAAEKSERFQEDRRRSRSAQSACRRVLLRAGAGASMRCAAFRPRPSTFAAADREAAATHDGPRRTRPDAACGSATKSKPGSCSTSRSRSIRSTSA